MSALKKQSEGNMNTLKKITVSALVALGFFAININAVKFGQYFACIILQIIILIYSDLTDPDYFIR